MREVRKTIHDNQFEFGNGCQWPFTKRSSRPEAALGIVPLLGDQLVLIGLIEGP